MPTREQFSKRWEAWFKFWLAIIPPLIVATLLGSVSWARDIERRLMNNMAFIVKATEHTATVDKALENLTEQVQQQRVDINTLQKDVIKITAQR